MVLATIVKSGVISEVQITGNKAVASFSFDKVSIFLTFWNPAHQDLLNSSSIKGQNVIIVGKLFSQKALEVDVDSIIFSNGDLNVVTLIGRAGRANEIRIFDSGKQVCKGSIAVSQFGRDETSWFNFEAWNKTADVVGNYVSKGDLFGVYGNLKVETYTNKEDKQVIKPVIVARNVYLLPKSTSRKTEIPNTLPTTITPSVIDTSTEVMF